MSVKTLLTVLALGLATISTAVALAGIIHTFTELSGGPHMLIHGLETWAVTVGHPVALTVLAAAGVAYLARKL